jgi:hypothetical protein
MTTHEAKGRPTQGGSRQQTEPDQGVQSGSKELDRQPAGGNPEREAARKYEDRPTNDGKHGDGSEESAAGPIATGKPNESR